MSSSDQGISKTSINSPPKAPDNTIGVELFENAKPVSNEDLQRLAGDEGILKHDQARTITESFITFQGSNAFSYEYEWTETPGDIYHLWGMNIAKGTTIISIRITAGIDNLLNSQKVANQILSTFKFLN